MRGDWKKAIVRPALILLSVYVQYLIRFLIWKEVAAMENEPSLEIAIRAAASSSSWTRLWDWLLEPTSECEENRRGAPSLQEDERPSQNPVDEVKGHE